MCAADIVIVSLGTVLNILTA